MNRRFRLSRLEWLGFGALGGTLILGCQSAPPHPMVLSAPPMVAAPANKVILPAQYSRPVMVTSSPGQPTVAPKTAASMAAAPAPVLPTLPPMPMPVKPLLLPRTTLTVSPAPPTIVKGPPAMPVPVPAPTAPRYGHATDYSSLTGEVQYSHVQKAWRLRYAPLSEEDRYGGSVTLAVADDLLGRLRAGQIVRIEGRLIDPASYQPSPAYRVSHFQPLR